MANPIRVEVVLAWPRRHEVRVLALPAGACVGDALAASGLASEGIVGYAVFGERVDPATALRDGDRLELLRALQADPKDARRRRAATQRAK
ncbi:MAG TPA: RnfH family protein [Xanthomonadaceae bacterium]|nr:RnfH family protein [Xanthomonadaceae bacterium]